MIITQTPIRISFLGGGTDLPDYFCHEDGCVLSSAINRYIFVIIKERFDDKIRVGYTRTEMVDHIDQLEHELVRECLRKTGITKKVEITTMGDIPSAGSGMGSSSTVTVGLLNAMYHFLGEPRDARVLAQDACDIEINVLGKPIGMQDQYIAAFGGQRFIRFSADSTVDVAPLQMTESQRRRLSERLMLFFTNVTRKAESVLAEQVINIKNGQMEALRQMKCLALKARESLEAEAFDEFGMLMHEGWEFKKTLASGITNGSINAMYQAARTAGALGGKITGAGGGGFLLLYCPPHKQDDVRLALKHLRELPFDLERDGTKVIFNYRR